MGRNLLCIYRMQRTINPKYSEKFKCKKTVFSCLGMKIQLWKAKLQRQRRTWLSLCLKWTCLWTSTTSMPYQTCWLELTVQKPTTCTIQIQSINTNAKVKSLTFKGKTTSLWMETLFKLETHTSGQLVWHLHPTDQMLTIWEVPDLLMELAVDLEY